MYNDQNSTNTSRKGHAIFTLCDMTYFLVVLLAVICGVIKELWPISYYATTRNATNARKSSCNELEVIFHGM